MIIHPEIEFSAKTSLEVLEGKTKICGGVARDANPMKQQER